jgi:gamma-D-glutamyl-L-lysine dipeptidyl-peptidase
VSPGARGRRRATGATPRWTVVTTAALDLRRRPSHRAELGSQLLLGELALLERRSPDGLWWRVRGPDGYPGWARSWGLRLLDPRQAARWRRQAHAVLQVPYAVVRRGPGRGGIVTPAYLHSRLLPLEARGAWQAVELPGGERGWIERRHLRGWGPARRRLGERIGQLLGTPYLWGGRTAMALDCSGFVQMVLMDELGPLPRDAHDQWLAARRLPRGARRRAGDLVFFARPGGRVGHVGVLLDTDTYAHARGTVHLSSLDPCNKIYDKELADTVRGFGRPSRAPR